ncbi:MAG: hypothetical protein Ct9H300mP16_10570 [Pseudomonadota bacterium]|nr:MAG: hypothetical protein Ct9H300mP16_10570 [Pseudomonadota bacterium]
MPIFTDTAIKGGLAKISEWAFRNVPNESIMYKDLFAWLRQEHPDLQTFLAVWSRICPFTVHLAQGYEGPGPGSRFYLC